MYTSLSYIICIADKFSSVKEQAFNFMWDGINWKKESKYFADK
jgi:hypothetical protein